MTGCDTVSHYKVYNLSETPPSMLLLPPQSPLLQPALSLHMLCQPEHQLYIQTLPKRMLR